MLGQKQIQNKLLSVLISLREPLRKSYLCYVSYAYVALARTRLNISAVPVVGVILGGGATRNSLHSPRTQGIRSNNVSHIFQKISFMPWLCLGVMRGRLWRSATTVYVIINNHSCNEGNLVLVEHQFEKYMCIHLIVPLFRLTIAFLFQKYYPSSITKL